MVKIHKDFAKLYMCIQYLVLIFIKIYYRFQYDRDAPEMVDQTMDSKEIRRKPSLTSLCVKRAPKFEQGGC